MLTWCLSELSLGSHTCTNVPGGQKVTDLRLPLKPKDQFFGGQAELQASMPLYQKTGLGKTKMGNPSTLVFRDCR